MLELNKFTTAEMVKRIDALPFHGNAELLYRIEGWDAENAKMIAEQIFEVVSLLFPELHEAQAKEDKAEEDKRVRWGSDPQANTLADRGVKPCD